MKITLQLTAMLFVFTLSNSIVNAQTSIDTTMYNREHVFSENEDAISYISYICGDETMVGGLHDGSDDGFIFIQFDIIRESKTHKGIRTESRYEMEVRTKDNKYNCRLRQSSLSLYENGKPSGHASLSLEWFEDDVLSSFILNFYQANRDKISIRTKSVPFPLEECKPLFAQTLNSEDESYVIKLEVEELYPPYGQIKFYCEILQFRTYEISTQPSIYSILSYNLMFSPKGNAFGNSTYSVSQKTNWIKEFNYEGQFLKEVQLPLGFDPPSRDIYESDFYKKVLEYYQSHRAEMDERYQRRKLNQSDF